ncbi:proteasome maturation protein-like [Tubulanus polymorphus]|uniref:proteasome maturation protein-like n=1 Tax=Tubulanus polymorphus TaxID=672921 RepID=UPI003DA60A3E
MTGDVCSTVPARQGPFGINEAMWNGPHNVESDLTCVHPLQASEQQFYSNEERQDLLMLRNTQGIHAPLKLQMERNVAKQIGRLPCFKSSNLMNDILTGKIYSIDFDDVLNTEPESVGNPHVLVEKKFGFFSS